MNDKLKSIALGADVEENVAEIEAQRPAPQNLEERVSYVEEQSISITNGLDNLFAMVKALREIVVGDKDREYIKITEDNSVKGRQEIPEGIVLIGTTRGVNYYLQARSDGFYVGIDRYETLSAAAQGVSGVRRSGWTFWHLPDGRTVKEVFRK